MAICPPQLSGWAERILDGLPETGNTSVGRIVSYLQYNLYQLNSRLFTDFSLSGECIVPDMTPSQSGIYTMVFYCQFLAKQAVLNLGAAAYQILEVEAHDQSRIRKVSKSTIAAGYRTEAKACNEELQMLVDAYNQGQFGATVGLVIPVERGVNVTPCGPGWDYIYGCQTKFGPYYLT